MKHLLAIAILPILTACALPINISISMPSPTPPSTSPPDTQSLKLAELAPLDTLEVNRESPYVLALSPSGDWLALADTAQLRVYAVDDTLQEYWETEVENGGRALAFSPDGTQLASQSGDVIHIWDVHTGELIQSISTGFENLWRVAFSPDGLMLAYSDGSPEPLTEVLDLQSNTVIQSLKDIGNLKWKSNSEIYIYGAEELTLWDISSGQQLTQLERRFFGPNLPWPGKAVGIGQQDIYFAEYEYGSLVIWDNERGRWGQTERFDTYLSDMAWSETGDLLAIGFRDGIILIWDTVEDKPILRLDTSVDGWVEFLLWRQDDTSLISEVEGVISLWEIEDK
jgi:WD40 repeat protein